MRIADLPQLVSAIKGHWFPEFPDPSLLKDGWVGFTPGRDNAASRAQSRATISRQMGSGYILEYVSIALPQPNAGSRPLTLDDRAMHAKAAGALTGVFKLANRPVHARELIGLQDYQDMQDRWDKGKDRVRWSEGFPIIEAWEIRDWPKARKVLGLESAARACEQLARGLKPLNEDDRTKLAPLEIVPIELPSDGFAARYFIDLAQQTNQLNGRAAGSLSPGDRGLSEDYSGIEGTTRDQRVRIVLRDRYLVKRLKQTTPLKCSTCTYDPFEHGASASQARAILEAHHTLPMQAGKRYRELRISCFSVLLAIGRFTRGSGYFPPTTAVSADKGLARASTPMPDDRPRMEGLYAPSARTRCQDSAMGEPNESQPYSPSATRLCHCCEQFG
jgi:hypothetical protein